MLKAFTTFNKTSDFSDLLRSLIRYLSQRFEVSTSEYIRSVFKHATLLQVFFSPAVELFRARYGCLGYGVLSLNV